MFSKIVLDNFKSFKHFEFDLHQNKAEKSAKNVAVIYGENAIGKSTVVDAFRLLNKVKNSIASTKFSNQFLGNGISNLQNQINRLYVNDDFLYSAPEYISIYKKIGSKDNMRAKYECFVGNDKFDYRLAFDSSSIVEEKLFINGDLGFGMDRYGNADLSDAHFFSEELKSLISERFKMYSGKHTLLACINSVYGEIDGTYGNRNISKTIRAFMFELEKLHVFKETTNFPVMFKYDSNMLPILVYGNYFDSMKQQLENTKTALSMFFTSIYSNINRVDYDIEVSSDNSRTYNLVFVEGGGENESRVPYSLASTGTKKLLELFPTFYEIVANDNIVVIDEIDSGINDILLKAIFDSLGNDVKGQLIVTTHNTLLLKNINKKYIYLLDRDEKYDQVVSYSLDVFGRQIQSGTDVVGQYLKGLYGGVPQTGFFSMKYIVDIIEHEKK